MLQYLNFAPDTEDDISQSVFRSRKKATEALSTYDWGNPTAGGVLTQSIEMTVT